MGAPQLGPIPPGQIAGLLESSPTWKAVAIRDFLMPVSVASFTECQPGCSHHAGHSRSALRAQGRILSPSPFGKTGWGCTAVPRSALLFSLVLPLSPSPFWPLCPGLQPCCGPFLGP